MVNLTFPKYYAQIVATVYVSKGRSMPSEPYTFLYNPVEIIVPIQ